MLRVERARLEDESRASGALTQKQSCTTWAWGEHGPSSSGPQKNTSNGTVEFGRQKEEQQWKEHDVIRTVLNSKDRQDETERRNE
jgi:hypothetical protein